MTEKEMKKLKTPIGKVIEQVDRQGLLVKSRAGKQYAIFPIDDDIFDLLLERSPKLMRECQRARDEVARGNFHTLEEVKAMFETDTRRRGVSRVRRSTTKQSRK